MEFKNIELIKKLYELEPGFLSAGLYFGFPVCCIEAFCIDETQKVIKTYPELESHGTGFIPCLECAKSVEKNWPQFLQKNILEHRVCKGVWPEGQFESDKTSFFQFFIDLTRHVGKDPKIECETLHPKYEKMVLKILRQEEKNKIIEMGAQGFKNKVKIK